MNGKLCQTRTNAGVLKATVLAIAAALAMAARASLPGGSPGNGEGVIESEATLADIQTAGELFDKGEALMLQGAFKAAIAAYRALQEPHREDKEIEETTP